MSDPIYRWRLDCGADGYATAPMTEAEVRQLADKVYPPPAVVSLTRAGAPTWERHGGEFADGGGKVPIEWLLAKAST